MSLTSYPTTQTDHRLLECSSCRDRPTDKQILNPSQSYNLNGMTWLSRRPSQAPNSFLALRQCRLSVNEEG